MIFDMTLDSAGHVDLRVPHAGVMVEDPVKTAVLKQLLNQPRIVYETAEIRTKQPKTKIPHVIEKPAGQVIPGISECNGIACAGDCRGH